MQNSISIKEERLCAEDYIDFLQALEFVHKIFLLDIVNLNSSA